MNTIGMNVPYPDPAPLQLIDSHQAGEWLGIKAKSFEKLAEKYREWLHPVYVLSFKFWDPQDVGILMYILKKQRENPPGEGDEDEDS